MRPHSPARRRLRTTHQQLAGRGTINNKWPSVFNLLLYRNKLCIVHCLSLLGCCVCHFYNIFPLIACQETHIYVHTCHTAETKEEEKYTPTASSIKCTSWRHAHRSAARNATQNSTTQKIKQASNKKKKGMAHMRDTNNKQVKQLHARDRLYFCCWKKKTSIGYKKTWYQNSSGLK